jgi:signal transduction histidine kinase
MSQNFSASQSLLEQAIDRHPLLMAPDVAVTEAIATMSQSHTSYILIAEEKKLLGIFTERDVVKLTASKSFLEEIAISQVMTKDLITITLAEAGDIYSVLALFRTYKIRHLPILKESGETIGVVTPDSLWQVLKPTVELLQLTITEKTEELRTVNQQMEWEVIQRQKAEEKLRQLNENLEEKIKQGILELREANTQLQQEICDRTEAEAEVRRLNAKLENRLEECTAQLAESNRKLAQVIVNLQAAQQELINSEKMASLGQLIAGIAHEINTPLAAIRSSVQNISGFLKENLEQLPIFFRELSPDNHQYFFALLQKSSQEGDTLSTKEKRQLKKALQRQLESAEIPEADSLACTLTDIGVYHEIEVFLPLLKSLNSSQILQTAYRFATLQKSTRTIATATERAAKIVFALKNYGRYDNSGKKVLANIIDGIETVLTLYHYQIKQGIEVIRNYAPNLPSILCYPDELNQVWTNLLHNALQAMDYRGNLKIEVKQEEQNLLVKITDTGKGIAPEIMPRIFDPFFTTKGPGEGSGLGLDIVNKIIDKHYGMIDVESQLGQTTFTVSLPLNRNQE